MKITKFILVSLFTINIISSSAQDYPLLTDHPGTFKLIDWGVYTHYDCGFTKTETTANYQKIISLTDLVRKNPVFINQKGFNCETYVYTKNCPDKFGYAIPSEISFGFCDWYGDKGQEKFYKIEPPSWKVIVNVMGSFVGGNYSLGASKPDQTPKPGFNYEKWKAVDAKLKEITYLKGEKEILGNGVDRYISEVIVIYNPDRPPYYLPVTFREIAELKIEYWRLHPNKIESDMILPMLEAEYALFSEADRDKLAYNNTYDSRCTFLGVTIEAGPQPVVRFNPEYWNKKLPRSSIQLLCFNRLTETKRYTAAIKESLKYNSPGYSLDRFLEAFDINTLVPAIDK